ncbi:anaerobic ribonucleoside-triphosphate reductase activating protein [Chitinispirillales bacterium ANBcel5]|uniref:anaerobic ribonucleoside-triphosphate reductase activating protein n=1 Tax=Cellulosispirillum alkaliphilum TaxID=3039283 RepID=UPI002A597641|nr:anaerobic ribonucleoside-triphosphate reductase activating protein [Chitinispirillales bacterium ANBcel5]
MSNSMNISAWLKSSFIDFPGTVSTVLFLSGCNLHCPFCHNPTIVKNENPAISLDDVLGHLKKRKGIIDGVVISGGEPTIHRELPALFEAVRELGVRVKLDTNGLNPQMIYRVKPDYLALDIKTVPEKYNFLGSTYSDTAQRLQQSIAVVRNMAENAEVRIPVVPDFIGDDEIYKFLRLLRGVKKVFLQPFQNSTELLNEDYRKKTPLSLEKLKYWSGMFKERGIDCSVRGQ